MQMKEILLYTYREKKEMILTFSSLWFNVNDSIYDFLVHVGCVIYLIFVAYEDREISFLPFAQGIICACKNAYDNYHKMLH